jgi:hypothetical protein
VANSDVAAAAAAAAVIVIVTFRVPLMIGSKKEVEYYESFYKN